MTLEELLKFAQSKQGETSGNKKYRGLLKKINRLKSKGFDYLPINENTKKTLIKSVKIIDKDHERASDIDKCLRQFVYELGVAFLLTNDRFGEEIKMLKKAKDYSASSENETQIRSDIEEKLRVKELMLLIMSTTSIQDFIKNIGLTQLKILKERGGEEHEN